MTASQTEATRSDELDVRRLLDVTGTDGKSNDVIVCPSANLSGQEQQHVIFFGGDIQVIRISSNKYIEHYANLSKIINFLNEKYHDQ